MTVSAVTKSPAKALVEPPPGLEHLAAAAAVSNSKPEQSQRKRGWRGKQEARAEKWKQKQSEKHMLKPPGLEFPPGLEEPLESSTTASIESSNSPTSPMYIKSSLVVSESVPVHRVQISGMPNALLSHLMLEAVLQQAQLSSYVVTFTTKPGKVSGEATVTMVSHEAAEWCVQHFQGCQWDASGCAVSAKHLPQAGAKAAAAPLNKSVKKAMIGQMSAEAVEFQPSKVACASQKTDLSLDAPVFMPGAWTAASMSEASMLCAEAPAFVPKKKFVTSSDVSTEDLGSESDEDKERLEAAA